MKFLIISLLSFSILSAAPLMTDNFAKGVEVSEGHNLPLALVFTGSDWSDNCKALLKEVSDFDLSKGMVLVHVDFPELNRQSSEILEQNHSLKEKYNVQSFPTLVLLGTDKKEIARIGYPLEGVSCAIDHLKKLERRYSLLTERFKKARDAKAGGELKFCYHEAQEIGALGLAEKILDVSVEGNLSLDLALEKFSTLMAAGKKEEASPLRKLLVSKGCEEILTRVALIDFQEEQSITPIESFLERFGVEQGKQFGKLQQIMSEFLKDEKQEEL